MCAGKRKRRKPKRAIGKVKFKILGIEISFNTILAGKIVFMIIISILFLWHTFFQLEVPIEWALPSYILAVAAFIITLNFGCDSSPVAVVGRPPEIHSSYDGYR